MKLKITFIRLGKLASIGTAKRKYSSVDNPKSKTFKDVVDSHLEVGFRKWEDMFADDKLKELLRSERQDLKACLLKTAQDYEEEEFKDRAVYSYHGPSCLRKWADKVEEHLYSASIPLQRHFPLIGTNKSRYAQRGVYKSRLAKITSLIRSFEEDRYKDKEGLYGVRGSLTPLLNPHVYHIS